MRVTDHQQTSGKDRRRARNAKCWDSRNTEMLSGVDRRIDQRVHDKCLRDKRPGRMCCGESQTTLHDTCPQKKASLHEKHRREQPSRRIDSREERDVICKTRPRPMDRQERTNHPACRSARRSQHQRADENRDDPQGHGTRPQSGVIRRKHIEKLLARERHGR